MCINSNPSHVQGVCPAGWHVPSNFWTAKAHETYENTAYYRNINYGMANVQEDSGDTFLGFSVRCVKD